MVSPIPLGVPEMRDRSSRGWGWWVAALVVGVMAARLAYLAWGCPYTLVEDEAQYWDWARHPALSYYTKGPGIAWTISATCAILGDHELGVRAAMPVFSALLALAMAALVRGVGGDGRAAIIAAAAAHLVPAFQATALLATIDGPYIAWWSVAALLGWRALSRGGRWNWLGLGLALGVGFLFKYTIVLLAAGVAAAGLMRLAPSPRADRRSPLGPMLALGGFLLAASPVLVWNADQGWPTVRHLMGHLGFAEGSAVLVSAREATGGGWSPWWMPTFVGTQAGLVGPVLGLAGIGAAVAWRRWRADRDASSGGRLYLAVCGAPVLVFYLLVSLVAEPEGNWPMGGYVTLVPLAALAASEGMAEWRRRVERWRAMPAPRPKEGWLRRRPETASQVLWHLTIGYGLSAGVLMLRVDLLAHAPVVGKYVPVGRLRQGADLASAVQGARERVREETGREPVVVAAHYGRASQLAFYLPDRPRVYCASSRLGGRPTPQDFWPTHDLDTVLYFGRPVVLMVGGEEAAWGAILSSVRDLGPVEGLERKGLRMFVGDGWRPVPGGG